MCHSVLPTFCWQEKSRQSCPNYTGIDLRDFVAMRWRRSFFKGMRYQCFLDTRYFRYCCDYLDLTIIYNVCHEFWLVLHSFWLVFMIFSRYFYCFSLTILCNYFLWSISPTIRCLRFIAQVYTGIKSI